MQNKFLTYKKYKIMKYSKAEPNNGRLESVDIYEGETIEKKVARITLTNEPITDTAPIIYTEK